MIFRFDRFDADDAAFRLIADGVPVALEPKALRLLLYLIQNRGRLIRKQELLNAVWMDAAVTESALTRSVGLLRKALDDNSRAPRFIETVPTAGFRFIAHVDIIADAEPDVERDTIPFVPPQTPAPLAQASPRTSSRYRVAAVTFLCLTAVTAFWFFTRRSRAEPIRSLAVLPLENLSGDPSQEYFADGMTDELTTELARIPNLRVVSRTSVLAGKGTHRPLSAIARQLDVEAIIEGSIVRSGDRIRITIQLIDTRTDRHLWAQSFEGSASDVLSLQDSVAQQIAVQTRLVLTPTAPHMAVNPGAHDAYLRGRYFFDKQDFSHSLESFQQAVTLDPTYASAFAGYASALDAAATFGIGTPEQLMPKAVTAAKRAIELDPQNGEAYTALGSVETIYKWNWTMAEQNITRGIALNPNDSIAEFKYAVYLDAVGRADAAVTHMRRAVQLNPLSFIINRRLGATLYLARHYDEALSQLQRAAEMEQHTGSIDNYISLIYEQKGERDQAVQHDLIALHEKNPRFDIAALPGIYQQRGWQAYWRARTRTILNTSSDACTAYEIGIADLRVNEVDQAFGSFQHALDSHCFYMALIRVDPLLDAVRHDSRYAALLKRMHQ
ncbi:winged helix-turn-helix domain-containing protein [Granulicella sp. L60]|uniref:winged helix-turn-helix domain-containing protein n=1 Tax=Granulicella sp. L60 TaxID=1641866 RepID=UPI00131E91B2|nr:winged helix-turn-helix domain-containing protein [Granulicella sp. L60]